MAKCKSCGAEIIWFKMVKTGKNMPVDLPGTKAIVAVSSEDSPHGMMVTAYTPHWATCPAADSFRKKKED